MEATTTATECARCALLDQLDDLRTVFRAGGVWRRVYEWYRAPLVAALGAHPWHWGCPLAWPELDDVGEVEACSCTTGGAL